ncbi:MAG: response regulator transcription factor [Myxococcaceae bacterium]
MSASNNPLVLVIEDDPICAAMLTEILTEERVEIIRARKLGDAQVLLNTRTFAGVVIDGLLPDGSGEDFVRRNRDLLGKTKVIFCSSFFRRYGTHERLKMDLGCESVLNKPFTRTEVLEAAATIIAQRGVELVASDAVPVAA